MPARSNISTESFDAEAAWSGLPAHVQARIGAIALQLGVGLGISEHADYPAGRAGAEAARLAGNLLQEAVLGYDGLRDAVWIDAAVGVERFRLPPCIGQACRACGCSYEDPCDEGCGWAEADLCTACAEAAPEAAALPPGGVVAGGETREEPAFPAQPFALAPLPDGWIGRDGRIVRDEAAAPGDRDVRGLPPVGRGLGALARAIEGMHLEGDDA